MSSQMLKKMTKRKDAKKVLKSWKKMPTSTKEDTKRKDTNKKRCHNKKDAKKITNEAKHVQFSGTRQLITQWHVRTLNTTSKYELLL